MIEIRFKKFTTTQILFQNEPTHRKLELQIKTN